MPGSGPMFWLRRSLPPRSKQRQFAREISAPRLLPAQAKMRSFGQVAVECLPVTLQLSAHRKLLIPRSRGPITRAGAASWTGRLTEVASYGRNWFRVIIHGQTREENKKSEQKILQLRLAITVRSKSVESFPALFARGEEKSSR